MTLDTNNPVNFLIDCIKSVVSVLNSYEFFNTGVSLWGIILTFIFIGMLISVFWRGARG